jgi:hypothetical protein
MLHSSSPMVSTLHRVIFLHLESLLIPLIALYLQEWPTSTTGHRRSLTTVKRHRARPFTCPRQPIATVSLHRFFLARNAPCTSLMPELSIPELLVHRQAAGARAAAHASAR